MGQCMHRIKKDACVLDDIPMTYAGRLDPMADGLVIFLGNEMRFYKEKFLGLQKTYQATFFLGWDTDTYDILGIAQKKSHTIDVSDEQVKNTITTLYSTDVPVTQTFPPFSSRKVSGKPLFVFAKQNMYIPPVSHEVVLEKISHITYEKIDQKLLYKKIIHDIDLVSGDFRQKLCKDSWNSLVNEFPRLIPLYSVELTVSSGFYVRSWVHAIGQKLHTGAVTFSITRSIIGVFTLSMLNNQSYQLFKSTDPFIGDIISKT